MFQLETLTGVRVPVVVTENDGWGRVISDEPIPGSRLRAIHFDPDGALSVDRSAFVAALAAVEEIDDSAFTAGRRYFHGYPVPA